MKSIFFKKLLKVTVCFLFFSTPLFAFAEGPGGPEPLPKDTSYPNAIVYVCIRGAPGECTFEDVILAVKHLINWGVEFALMFSVIIIVFAGFKYMTSEGSPGKISEANKMFASVAKGIVLIMAAWLIVTLITGALLKPEINTFLK